MDSVLRVIPLGGLGEVGKNMTVYEADGARIVVDAGMSFPRDEHLGVDVHPVDLGSPDALADELGHPAEPAADVEDGVALAREIGARAADFFGAETIPGPDYASRDDLARWIERAVGIYYHPTSTCCMGPPAAGGGRGRGGRPASGHGSEAGGRAEPRLPATRAVRS